MVDILLVDDHTIVRKGLKRLIEDAPDLRITAEAGDGREALGKCRKHPFDVIVLDISMPGMNGLEFIKQCKNSRKGKVPILVLSMHPEEMYAVRMIRAGAAGYLTKEKAPEELIDAIRRVAGNGLYITQKLAEMLANEIAANKPEQPHKKLSDREYEVLLHIASGKTQRQIAQELYISAKTVGTYRARIFEKMNMHSTAELTHYAIKNNLYNE